jgi:uncharacterized protein
MELSLKSKPKGVTIIEGFPGYGLIGTIVTEYLIKHLDAKRIGKIRMYEVSPMVAVHESEVVEPLGIFYDKKKNIVILHALSSVSGYEWKIAELIKNLAKQLNAKEIISIEGVGSQLTSKESSVYALGENKKIKSLKIPALKEGIIVGVTGALLLKEDLKLTCLFAETESQLPDSRAAAQVLKALNDYLKLKIDVKPLLEKASKFEDKLKEIMGKAQEQQAKQEEKKPSYFG